MHFLAQLKKCLFVATLFSLYAAFSQASEANLNQPGTQFHCQNPSGSLQIQVKDQKVIQISVALKESGKRLNLLSTARKKSSEIDKMEERLVPIYSYVRRPAYAMRLNIKRYDTQSYGRFQADFSSLKNSPNQFSIAFTDEATEKLNVEDSEKVFCRISDS